MIPTPKPCTTLQDLNDRLASARRIIETYTSEASTQERIDAAHAVDVALLTLAILSSHRDIARADMLVSHTSTLLIARVTKEHDGDADTPTA